MSNKAKDEMKAAVLLSCERTGTLALDVDGFYYFVPDSRMGIMCAASMRIIADRLDELNKEWNEKIDKEL